MSPEIWTYSGNGEKSMTLARFLRIAIGLAAALAQVHRNRLLHKDIKPANVLVNDAGKVWLTGFGIASQVPRERQAPVPPEIIAGTLAYMAPEQTGRMNRSIDARSDLYSFGVTLAARDFFTGAAFCRQRCPGVGPLPYYIKPTPPGNRAAVPDPLSAHRRGSSPPWSSEERYQTLRPQADLRLCLEQWQSHGASIHSRWARDCSEHLLIPEKLYGRERGSTPCLRPSTG